MWSFLNEVSLRCRLNPVGTIQNLMDIPLGNGFGSLFMNHTWKLLSFIGTCRMWYKTNPSSITQPIHQTWLWMTFEWGWVLFLATKGTICFHWEFIFKVQFALKSFFYKESRYIPRRQHLWNIGIISCGDCFEEKVLVFAEGLAPYLIRPVTWGQIGPVKRITVFKVKCFKVDFLLWLLLLMWPWLIWRKNGFQVNVLKWGQGWSRITVIKIITIIIQFIFY